MPRKSKDRRVVMLAGFVAGGLEATATWPTEYVKTQLQLQRGTGLYRGFWDCARQTVGQYGPLGLYRGLGPVLVFSMPKAGVRFWAFETASKLLGGGEKKASAARNFAAGIMAGVLEATLIVTPQETLKVKLINANKGMLAGTAHIVRTEGLRGVYRGLFPTILKQASNQGVRFLSYNEIMNRFIKPGRPDQPPTAAQALLGGTSAGCISVLANNPIDTVKTRMQGLEASRYASTLDCAKQLVTNEGVGAFYKGALSRMGRVVPGQGLVFMSYESVTDALERFFGVGRQG